MAIQIRRCGEKLVIAFPGEVVARLGWGQGDLLEVEVADDSLKSVRSMTAHDHAMKIAGEAMNEYRETFEALAKS